MCTRRRWNFKGTVPTWSPLWKKNTQAKEIYCVEGNYSTFSLPEENHEGMRKRLKIVISIYFCIRVESDTAKHLQRRKLWVLHGIWNFKQISETKFYTRNFTKFLRKNCSFKNRKINYTKNYLVLLEAWEYNCRIPAWQALTTQTHSVEIIGVSVEGNWDTPLPPRKRC